MLCALTQEKHLPYYKEARDPNPIKDNEKPMKIGQVAKKTGVSLRTIRYYEELDLISPRGRSNGGFRLYDEEALSRIQLIQSLQQLELSLRQIKTLLTMKDENRSRGELARTLLSELKGHCEEAERRRCIYETIVQDFDEGIKILSDCQTCTRMCRDPHCGKHRVFISGNQLPIVLRSLF
jgi:DNA-binding transcriptional MerR regulator